MRETGKMGYRTGRTVFSCWTEQSCIGAQFGAGDRTARGDIFGRTGRHIRADSRKEILTAKERFRGAIWSTVISGIRVAEVVREFSLGICGKDKRLCGLSYGSLF